MANPLKDLALLVRSHFGLVFIDTVEDERVDSLLQHLADREKLPYFTWTATKGLKRPENNGSVYKTEVLAQALGHIENSASPGIYFFQGLGSQLTALSAGIQNGGVSHDDRMLLQRLKDLTKVLSNTRGALIVTGSEIELPADLVPLATRLTLPAPDVEDFKGMLAHLLRDLSQRARIEVKLTSQEGHRLLRNLRGLTLMEARKVLTRILIEDGRLGPEDVTEVLEAKKKIVQNDGVLEYYAVEDSLQGIAGMNGLKAWLAKRREIIANPERAAEFGLSFPKGILLLGVQGCGKSLCAKAVAMEWELPLLKFDSSKLYNKYMGESEKNFNRAVKTAERMSPVILWIDEIEKAFASGGDEDGGVSQRILGAFLSWMQDRRGDVFVIATANNIEKLPPELLRKGRFDEIFFVDLPSPVERRAVFEIHLKKRGRRPEEFDLDPLVTASEGFSGAEIEQAIVSALYSAFSSGAKVNTNMLLREISVTKPLSQTFPEKIAALRTWAAERTVSAN